MNEHFTDGQVNANETAFDTIKALKSRIEFLESDLVTANETLAETLEENESILNQNDWLKKIVVNLSLENVKLKEQMADYDEVF